MKRALLASVVVLLITGVPCSACAQSGYLRVPDDLVIEFRNAANVVNRDIMFTDIASIASSDREFTNALEQVNLGPAPSTGYTRKLTTGYIELRLRQQRINPGSLDVDIPGSILIRSETTVLPGSSIVSAAKDYVDGEMGSQALVDLKAGYVPDLVVPLGEPSIECALAAGSQEQRYIAVGATVSVGGYPVGFVRVEFGQPSLAAAQHAAETGLPGESAYLVPVDATAFSASVFPTSDGSSPYLVQRGDLVRVSVRTSFAEVTAVGEARGNGKLGDLIEVRNVDTGKRFYGRVVSAGVVEVDFSG